MRQCVNNLDKVVEAVKQFTYFEIINKQQYEDYEIL